jgi:hypothetical protein
LSDSERLSVRRLLHVITLHKFRFDFAFHFLRFEPDFDHQYIIQPLNSLSLDVNSHAIRYAVLSQCAWLGFFDSAGSGRGHIRHVYHHIVLQALQKSISRRQHLEVAYTCLLMTQLFEHFEELDREPEGLRDEWETHVYGMWAALECLVEAPAGLSERQFWFLEMESLKLMLFLSGKFQFVSSYPAFQLPKNRFIQKAMSLLLTLTRRFVPRYLSFRFSELVVALRLVTAVKIFIVDPLEFAKDIVPAILTTVEQLLGRLKSSLSPTSDVDETLSTCSTRFSGNDNLLWAFSRPQLEDLSMYVRFKIIRCILDSWYGTDDWESTLTACMELIAISEERILFHDVGAPTQDSLESSILDLFFAGLFLTKSRNPEGNPHKGNWANYPPANTWIKSRIENLLNEEAMKSSQLAWCFPESHALLDLADRCSCLLDILGLEYERESVSAWFLRIRLKHATNFDVVSIAPRLAFR